MLEIAEKRQITKKPLKVMSETLFYDNGNWALYNCSVTERQTKYIVHSLTYAQAKKWCEKNKVKKFEKILKGVGK